MIVYEVNLVIDMAIAAEYRAWLGAHVDELLTLPGFLDARILDVLEPAPTVGQVALCVQYTLRDQAALGAYLRGHAPRMRAAGITRFGERFQAARRVLREAALR
ncbi:MAG TPA: DUF4286 family protein [Luteimonas sp.]|nr:DUF4286 family protein [Luteimonas sp.]